MSISETHIASTASGGCPVTAPGHDRDDELAALLEANHRKLMAYLVMLLGNRHDAEDVLQRASLIMWRRFDTFTTGTNFLAWARQVAHYEAKNFRRAARRSRLQFSDPLLENLAKERGIDDEITDRRTEALGRCLDQLEDCSRRLVVLAYSEDSGLKKIAQELGRAPQTIHNKLTAIRRILAACVSKTISSG